MKHITTADALRALEEAVAEKGEDYIYPHAAPGSKKSCRYVERDESGSLVPSCLVGNALVRLGVPVESLFDFNTGYDPISLASSLNLPIDEPACRALHSAQGAQDGGKPWGYALDVAREAVPDA